MFKSLTTAAVCILASSVHSCIATNFKVEHKPGIITVIDTKTNKTAGSILYWEHEKSPQGKIAFCGDLYVGIPYRNQGLLDLIYQSLKIVLHAQGYSSFQCFVEPFEREILPDGSQGNHMYDADPALRSRKLSRILTTYAKRGGKTILDAQGNPLCMKSPTTGKECIILSFSIP